MLEEEERKIAFYVNCATPLNTNREDKLLNSALWGTNFLELTVMRKNDKERGMSQNVAGSWRQHIQYKEFNTQQMAVHYGSQVRDICCNHMITEWVVRTASLDTIRRIWSFHSIVAEYPGLLGWGTVSLGRCFVRSHRDIVPLSSWVEDEDTVFLAK